MRIYMCHYENKKKNKFALCRERIQVENIIEAFKQFEKNHDENDKIIAMEEVLL